MTSRSIAPEMSEHPERDTSHRRNGPSLVCASCQHSNLADRKFCSSCGEPLWRKCLNCKAECPAVDTFCGECGANQKQLALERVQAIDAAMSKAKELHHAGDFSQAVMALRSLPDVDHVTVRTRLAEARKLADDIVAERSRIEQDVDQATAEAERWLAERRYKDVIQRLQGIPQASRTLRIQQLLQEAEASYREIQELRGQIAREVEARRLTALAPHINRYLDLQPEDQKVRVLSERVRDHITGKIREAIAASEFDQAGKLFDCIPICSIDSATRQLQGEVHEVIRLQNELRHAPHVDRGLLAVAERLCQLVPQSPSTATLRQKAKERLERGPTTSRSPLIPWAANQSSPYLGIPVDWLGGFAKLKAASKDVELRLRNLDGEFYVAAGLCLQGLNRSPIAINLMPKDESGGLLGRLTRFKKGPAVKHAWGLDVGRTSMKVIKLQCGEKPEDGGTILACDHFPLRTNLALPDAEKQRVEIIREAVQAWRDKYQPTAEDAICVSCPSCKTLGRYFQVPAIAPNKLEGLISYEAAQRIPIALHELTWGFQVLENRESTASVTVMAMRTGDAKDQLQPFEQLGLTVHTLQSEAFALHNFLQFDGVPAAANHAGEKTAEVAILDVGSDAVNLVVSSADYVGFRPLRWGGNDISLAMAKEYRLTFAQAEDLKQNLGRAKRLGDLLNTFDQAFGKLTSEVQRSLDAFNVEHPDRAAKRILVCGGGAKQFGLLRFLKNGPTRLSK